MINKIVGALSLLLLTLLSGQAGPTAAVAPLFYVGSSAGEIFVVRSDGTSSLFGNVTVPEGMQVDAAGNLYVADDQDDVIYKFTPAGARSVFISGLNGPSDLAFDSLGRLYVADTSNARIVRYSAAGVSLGTYVSSVPAPEAMTFDEDDNLFVASSSGNEIVQYPAANPSPTPFASPIPNPVTLTFDTSFTHVYVGAGNSGNILMYDLNGNATPFPATIAMVADMTFDFDGNFYVLDSNGHSIQLFPAGGGAQTTFATLPTTNTLTGFVFIPPPRTSLDGSGTVGSASFSFSLARVKKGKLKGTFSYSDPGAGLAIQTSKLSNFTISGNHAHFSGTDKIGKRMQISFSVDVVDNGSPGTLDTFSISTNSGYSRSGNLTSGDIDIH